jgi:hypothetical protein
MPETAEMDNEQAKLILHAYRPGGQDAGDPFFAEALEQARLDPELDRWFGEQRAFDEAMGKAVQFVNPPAGLWDSVALTSKVSILPRRRTNRPAWRHPGMLALAATLVVLLAVAALMRPVTDRDAVHPMTVATFAKQALDIAGSVSLGKMSSNPAELRAWLAERGAPSNFEIPPGLRDVPGIGCQSYTLDGTKVSLVCFMLSRDQIVHLFVVDEGALKDAAAGGKPVVRMEDGFAVATWTSGGKSYVLTGMNVSEETLRRLI